MLRKTDKGVKVEETRRKQGIRDTLLRKVKRVRQWKKGRKAMQKKGILFLSKFSEDEGR